MKNAYVTAEPGYLPFSGIDHVCPAGVLISRKKLYSDETTWNLTDKIRGKKIKRIFLHALSG